MRVIFLLFLSVHLLFSSVGEIITLKNDVNIIRDNKVIGATVGMKLEAGDTLNTFAKSMARVQFEDNTVVTLGRDSRFSINDYLYGAKGNKTELAFTKGLFKVVTGQIGKIAPEQFRLKTRTATMGIRGTEIDGFVSRHKEVITCTKGAIWLEANGKRVDINEGESTIILPGKAPTEPKNYHFEKLIREGLAAFEAGEFERSASIFTELIGLDGENPIFYYYLGKSQFRLKAYDKAIDAFKKVLTFDKAHLKSHYELGVTYYVIEELDRAMEEFETVISKEGSQTDVKPLTYALSYYWLAKIQVEKENYGKAAEYYKKVLEFKLKPKFRNKVETELESIKSSTGE